MRVQHNIPAMNAYRNYNNNSKSINRNLEKLSSGYRINRAGDDAAGLAISEKMRAQITGLEVAQKNAKDGISLVQTAEASLTEVQDMLNRMYSLAEQSANGTYAGDGTDKTKIDRDQLNKEVIRLREEIDRIANTANFNGTNLLDNSLSSAGGGGGGTVTASATVAKVGSYESAGLTASNVDTSKITSADANGVQISVSTLNTNGIVKISGTGITATVKVDGTDTPISGTSYRFTPGTARSVEVALTKNSTSLGTVTIDVSGVTHDATNRSDGITISASSSGGGAGSTGATTAASIGPTAMGDSPDSYSISSGLVLWIGAEANTQNSLTVNIDGIRSSDLKITDSTVNISTQGKALSSLRYIEAAIDKVSGIRGELGATQNRLEHTINNLSAMQENMQDAESTIRDTDVAEEMMKYTKNSILVQSAQAMLAQANQLPQGVLQLLQ